MGQVLHRRARTTAAVRRAIQYGEESIAELARRYGLHPKTAQKCKKRTHAHDAPMGPKKLCVAFRKRTWLVLDNCLYARKAACRI